MSEYTYILILILLFVIIIQKYNNLKNEIKQLKKNQNEHLTNTPPIQNVLQNLDDQSLQNFISLIKGDAINIKALHITGDVNIDGKLNVNNDVTFNKTSNIIGKLIVTGESTMNNKLIVNGESTLNGKLIVTNGSDFSGGRHYFEDEEKAGKLRVGAGWGMPGIYSGNKLSLGSKNFHTIVCDDSLAVISNMNLQDRSIWSTYGPKVNIGGCC